MHMPKCKVDEVLMIAILSIEDGDDRSDYYSQCDICSNPIFKHINKRKV